jgi:hypothetical protein
MARQNLASVNHAEFNPNRPKFWSLLPQTEEHDDTIRWFSTFFFRNVPSKTAAWLRSNKDCHVVEELNMK